jgi:hypothetical protein
MDTQVFPQHFGHGCLNIFDMCFDIEASILKDRVPKSKDQRKYIL